MQACANLLSKDDEILRAVIEEAFQHACKDGQVGEMVLYHLRGAAPEDLYNELLSEFRGKQETIHIEDLPPEWRRNVFGSRSERGGRRSSDDKEKSTSLET